MDIKKIKEFIDLAKKEGVASLKYEEKDLKVSVEFATGEIAPIVSTRPQMSAPAAAQAPVAAKEVAVGHELKSPFVGTFYISPAPGKPPFAKVGDRVKKGQTLCILEAMKIMNEIEADRDGEVLEICVENESLVEYGQVLFRIK